jgi:hypothetical protein
MENIYFYLLNILKAKLFLFGIILSAFLFISCEDFSSDPESGSNASAEIIVEMLYFDADSIHFNSTADNWTTHKMEKISPRLFKYMYPEQTGERRFGMTYFMHNKIPLYGFFKDWNGINSLTGIKYSKVKINEVEINKSFLRSNGLTPPNHWVDFTYKLSDNGSPVLSGESYSINDSLSPEAAVPYSTTNPKYDSLRSISTHIQGWLVALHNNHSSWSNEPSIVEVESIKLFAKINGQFIQQGNTYVYTPSSNFSDGKLYLRYPYFPHEPVPFDYSEPMPAFISAQGILTFYPRDSVGRVWHWWEEPRHLMPSNATDFRLEARVKLTGPVSVQAGIDFKTATSSQWHECASGDWYFKRNEWITVVCESHSGN